MTGAGDGDRKSAALIAFGAVSGLGRGTAAFRGSEAGSAARVAIARDAELASAGLARPFASRACTIEHEASRDDREALRDDRDRAEILLETALLDCARSLDEARPGWRGERVGLCAGTSSGAMRTAERVFEARLRGEPIDARLARIATYFAPLAGAVRGLGNVALRPSTQILGACASATIAIGLSLRWLQHGRCDLVLCGGYDAVSVLVAGGFEALRATAERGAVRPFRLGRDGMALGEGAAIVALVRAEDARGAPVFGYVDGFGASTDAVHMTAPDREGTGLARAAARALADAAIAPATIDLVSAHATATPFNDAAEARALRTVFASAHRERPGDAAIPPVHAFKSQIGHTLGAAGVLESLSALDAMARGVAPASAGGGALDPDCAVPILERGEVAPLRTALKLSAAFGGANAALVLSRDPPSAAPSDRAGRVERQVRASPAVRIDSPWPHERIARAFAALADRGKPDEAGGARVARTTVGSRGHTANQERTVARLARLARLDRLGLLGISAVMGLAERLGSLDALRGAGIVVGHRFATVSACEEFFRRCAERKTRVAEPRLFPATSPNAVAGECAIVFELTGPGFAVGGGLQDELEAFSAAHELCAAGDADRMVVLTVDGAGTAADLARAAGWAPIREGATAVLLEVEGCRAMER